MGGYQYGRGDSTGEDPRSQGQGGGRRGYSSSGGSGAGGGARGYGGNPADAGGGGGRQQPQQPASGYGSGGGGYDPYGGSSGSPASGGGAGGGRGRRGYGAPSSRRGTDPITGEVVPPGYSGGSAPPAGPEATRVQDAAEAPVPGPRRSRLEERRAARGGEDVRDASQTRSDQYPESALNGRSTRNGAAARARAGARGRGDRPRPTGPVKKAGYHRYFDYPRTGKYGWRHWAPSIRQVSGCFLAGFFLVLGLVAYEYETVQIPDPHSLALAQQTSYDYSDGTTQFDTDGATDRTVVDITQIPMAVQNAVVSQEDKTFWTNPGVSYTGTARALLVDLTGGSTQGGSTITQQYVKQAYLNESQTTSRKIDEIFISLKLAKKYDKKTILADYLNVSPFGRDTSGIAAGVQKWFGIDLAQMSAEPQAEQDSQAAFLAMMVNSPTTYSDGWDPSVGTQTEAQDKALALTRWKDTLSNMELYKYITPSDYAWAVAHPPTPVPLGTASGTTILDSQMKTAALSWLQAYESANPNSNLPTPTEISNGGYTVVTTFNQKYMQYANSAVTTQLISQENKVDQSTLQAGLAAVDPSTGDLVAFYGGDASQNNYENNATQRTEQAGSSFKLFTLATAFSQGWSPDSYISGDSPWPAKGNTTEQQENQGGPSIKNDSSGDSGLISLQTATDASVNTAFVRIEEQVQGQYGAVRAMAGKFGLTDADMNTNDQWDSSQGCDNVRFTLGICFTDPARMADAYSVIAAGGVYHPLTEILSIKDNSTDQTFTIPTTSNTAVTPNVAAEVSQMLKGVIHNSDGTAYAGYTQSGLNMANIAGKTGTGTMDITNTTLAAEKSSGFDGNSCTNSDGSTQCGTGGVWFDGFSSKLAISVGISRWANVTVNGQSESVQLPVDNIDGSGSAYGAQYPFKIWASFMNQMQNGTPYAGDPAFTTPVVSPSETVMNSPTPTTVATTASASKTATPPTPTQPGDVPTSPTDTATAGTPTDTCQAGLLGFGDCSTSSSSSPTATATDTGRHGGGGGG
jgi:membrane peptidoglycan carboxypeptidase